jgi:hypothetical protein
MSFTCLAANETRKAVMQSIKARNAASEDQLVDVYGRVLTQKLHLAFLRYILHSGLYILHFDLYTLHSDFYMLLSYRHIMLSAVCVLLSYHEKI